MTHVCPSLPLCLLGAWQAEPSVTSVQLNLYEPEVTIETRQHISRYV
jgi:hypothetical protein